MALKRKINSKGDFVIFLIFLALFIFIIFDHFTSSIFSQIDRQIYNFIPGIRNEFVTSFMIFLTFFGDYKIVLLVGLILSGILYCYNKKREISFLASGLILGFLSEIIIKLLVQRQRPIGIIEETGFSFPSGHAVLSVIFFSLMIYLISYKIKNKFLKILFIAACILIPLIIILSRVYLGVHWFSDTLGGIFLGFAVVFGIKLFYEN